MQVIYGPNAAANIQLTAQKRLVRAVYAQTQGFPYSAVLDPYMRDTSGNIRVPQNGDTAGSTPSGGAAAAPLTRTGTCFTLSNSIIPGTVMVKSGNSEYVSPANGSTSAAVQPMGLLGQWVGGTFDGVGQTNQVGIWQGPDSVYDLLSPAWDFTTISTAMASQAAGQQINLYAGTNGLLYYTGSPTATQIPVARAIQQLSSAVLRIQLLV